MLIGSILPPQTEAGSARAVSMVVTVCSVAIFFLVRSGVLQRIERSFEALDDLDTSVLNELRGEGALGEVAEFVLKERRFRGENEEDIEEDSEDLGAFPPDFDFGESEKPKW